jgi:Bacterial transglutaminase-like N-terminal region
MAIVHTTNYRYRHPVGLSRHRMMLRPDDSHDLRLHEASLAIDPSPVSIRWAHDVFNNSICLVEWPSSLRTKHLTIVSTLDLTHHPEGPALPDYTLDPSAEVLPFSTRSRRPPISPASPDLNCPIRMDWSPHGRAASFPSLERPPP